MASKENKAVSHGEQYELVSVLPQTHFTRGVNAFKSFFERVSHAEQTRFGTGWNAFCTQSERVLVLFQTRSNDKRVIPCV